MICSVPSVLLLPLLTKRARTRLAWGKSTGQLTSAATIDAPLSSTSSSSSFQRKFVNKTKRERATSEWERERAHSTAAPIGSEAHGQLVRQRQLHVHVCGEKSAVISRERRH